MTVSDTPRVLSLLGLALCASLPGAALAAPPSQLAILRACGDADYAAQCERVIEADQIRQFPDIAARAGDTLRLKGRNGPIVLRDLGNPEAGDKKEFRAYAFWDYWFLRNAAVVSVSGSAGDHYLVVDLIRGTQTKIAAEPILAPDGSRFLVVDMCETQCGNTMEVWRYDRDRIYRERSYKPPEKWYEADIRWKDPATLEIEFSTAVPGTAADGEAGPTLSRARPRVMALTDRAWTRDEVPR